MSAYTGQLHAREHLNMDESKYMREDEMALYLGIFAEDLTKSPLIASRARTLSGQRQLGGAVDEHSLTSR